MKIGIVSDTHNNLKNIFKICEIFNSNSIDLVIHTGDISLPKALKAFDNLEMEMIGVFGNNDLGEKVDLINTSKNLNCHLFEGPHSLEIDNLNISIVHDPNDISDDLLKKSNIIFHGHTHRYNLETVQDTVIFNPGECAGMLKGKNKVGILETNPVEIKTISF